MNYFIADTHFNHPNVLKYDGRPFSSIEEHDMTLADNIRKTVGEDDHLYFLGDFAFGKADYANSILNTIHCKKHLITGNHDTGLLMNKEFVLNFIEIVDYKELYVDKRTTIILSHYPIICFKNSFRGWIHFYGHVHNTFENNIVNLAINQIRYESLKNGFSADKNVCRAYNVGCMMPYMNYFPRTMDDILSVEG